VAYENQRSSASTLSWHATALATALTVHLSRRSDCKGGTNHAEEALVAEIIRLRGLCGARRSPNGACRKLEKRADNSAKVKPS